ncbi:hypothetical protein DFH07DRAFT_826584 [Mycena maculata]|uniref:Uncharacterized protein n=1 Tax=Mycena maculata TaxID=230809 RepID=A0AAD7N9D0_9AGAR|nr:hypothetical protein DFH07DRAFT_826584 [Mycena maculata]
MTTVPPTGFSLTDNASLEYVLADIPFFCVGLTALAVFAFFMVMRRVSLPAVYLYTSSILAFGAAILDLVQILLRGTTNTDANLDLDSVSGIVDAREVGLALAFGFRFLYLWTLVAQRPRYEPRPRTQVDPLFSDSNLHSASWERWGAFGFILKFAILGSVISIPILQIIWRIATGFSPVYIAESTVQIAVSVLLIAKLMLNLFLSQVAPWWNPLVAYVAPFIALMISTGIGTGNLLYFKFSETTLGRFLQAVETYTLILSLLILTFYKTPRFISPQVPAARKRSSFFPGLLPKAEESPFQVSPPITETPVIEIGPRVVASERPSPRTSPIQRISSWVSARRQPRPNSGEQKLWDAGDAELGISTEMRSTTPEAPEMSPRVEVADEPRPALVITTKPQQNVVPPTPNTAYTLELPTPSTARPFTGVSFASYYGMATNARLTMPSINAGDDNTRNTESPVYGLNGIIARTGPAPPESPILSRRPPSPPPASLSAQRDSANSFDELLRQQTELDKSIAALRLFSPTTTVMSLPPPPEPEDKSSGDISGRTLSMSSGKSASNRSEFSLSIFPDPPAVERSSVFPESLPIVRARDPPFGTGRSRRQSRIPRSAISNDPEGLSASGSPVNARFESSGTQYDVSSQYDVTSFIGDLTTPAPSGEPRMGVLGEVTETELESDTAPDSAATLRPLFLSSRASTITSLPPATASSGVLTGSAQQPTYEYPILKPLLLGSTAPAVPSPLSGGARRTPGPSAFTGPRRPSRPGQARPVISIPRQLEENQTVEAEFERPRRPPALNLQQE